MVNAEKKNDFLTYRKGISQLLSEVQCSEMENQVSCEYGIEKVILAFKQCREMHAKIIWIGNGGSAAIASHSSIDYWNTVGIKSMCFNEAALLTCISNDYGYAAVYEKPIQMFAEENDIVVAISSSGKSENIIRGVKAAYEKRCKVITFSGFSENNPLRKMGDVNFYVPSVQYGPVELVHSFLCHSILDVMAE